MQIKVSRKGRGYEGRRTVQDRRRKREKEWKEIGKADMGTFLTFAQECCVGPSSSSTSSSSL